MNRSFREASRLQRRAARPNVPSYRRRWKQPLVIARSLPVILPLQPKQPSTKLTMLYLGNRDRSFSPETTRALHAADGYLYLSMPAEALDELHNVIESENELPAVLLARNRALLHMKRWEDAEQLSQLGAQLYPDEEEFTVQRAFSLHQMARIDQAAEVLQAAPAWIRNTGILYYNLACYQARLGDLSAAKQCIDTAIGMNAAIKKSARVDPDLAALWN